MRSFLRHNDENLRNKRPETGNSNANNGLAMSANCPILWPWSRWTYGHTHSPYIMNSPVASNHYCNKQLHKASLFNDYDKSKNETNY